LGWRLAALINGFKDATAYQIEFFIEISVMLQFRPRFNCALACDVQSGWSRANRWDELFRHDSYTLVSVLFSQIRGGDSDFELAELIRNGQLSIYLMRPVSVIEFIYIRGAAPRYFVASISFLIGVVGLSFLVLMQAV